MAAGRRNRPPARLERIAGRGLFGADPAAYDRARPDYPRWVFDALRARCGLAQGARVLEIGAGTGKATGALLARGADPLVAVEPDPRLAAFLRTRFAGHAVSVIAEPFETAELGGRQFDLAVCATAFHWLDEDASLARIADLLRPGGWWAALWNVFGDPERDDAFHDATLALLAPLPPLRSPSAGEGGLPFALDEQRRRRALARAAAFEPAWHRRRSWTLTLDPDQTVALYATYSNIAARPDRVEVLAELRRIAAEGFPRGVTRNMITSLFLARRR
ncbi:MAG TPA: class I SAM-dependent methyltransferase [Caulobacteraceae bacterium]